MRKLSHYYDDPDAPDTEDSMEFIPSSYSPLSKSQMIRIRQENYQVTPPAVEEIENIEKRSIKDPDATFNHLYRLLYDPTILYLSLTTIMKKPGSLAEGIDKKSTDSINDKYIQKISNQLKEGSFKFKPIKRIFIQKGGKDPDINKKAIKLYKENQLTKEKMKELKMRPLGILTTTDKLVSEALRLILNAIYEPTFERQNCNFGFRPGLGCNNAIEQIKTKAKAHKFAIEADIKGAFDSIDHEILINILSKKIKDQRFLQIIRQGLKCGIFFAGNIEQSKVGTTQGSNTSPLLYNIYFAEFDSYIRNEFTQFINIKNSTENRVDDPLNYIYSKLTKNKSKLKKQLESLTKINSDIHQTLGNNCKLDPEYNSNLEIIKSLTTQYTLLDKKQKTIPRSSARRKTIRFTYIRYADDWIFTTNATLEETTIFKNMFSSWIQDNLKLELSEAKTKITPLNKKPHRAKFLGFTLAYHSSLYIRTQGRTRVNTRSGFKGTKFRKLTNSDNRIPKSTKKIATPTLVIAFERDRVLPRLTDARFIKKKGNQYYGRSKPEWSILPVPEIIQRYNYVISGYLNYYAPNLTYTAELNFLVYLLQYSCLHTLANKFNTSISKIIKKFGKTPSIKYKIETKKKVNDSYTKTILKEKEIKLIDWSRSKEIISSAIENFNRGINPSSYTLDQVPAIKYNWRTKFKLNRHCAICGSTNKIEYHHVRHIKVGKVEGFLQVMNQLNRRQIPTCRKCHLNIHAGKYDGLKVSDLYDERLIIL